MIEQIRRTSPADVARLPRASSSTPSGCSTRATTSSRRRRSCASPTWCASRPTWSACAPIARCTPTVSRFVRDEHLRQALSFHTLLVGGNPFDTSAIYTLIHYLERRWGVFFPRGGTGALVRALVALSDELGGELRLSSPVARIDVLRDGTVRASRQHAERERAVRPRGLERRPAPHLRRAAARRAARRRARAAASSRSTGRCRCSCSTSAPTACIATSSRTTPSCSGRATRSCSPRSSAAPRCRTTSACTCTRRPSPIRRSRPPGCDAFYVLAPVPHLGPRAARLDERSRRPTPSASWPRSRSCCPTCAGTSSSRRWRTPETSATS